MIGRSRFADAAIAAAAVFCLATVILESSYTRATQADGAGQTPTFRSNARLVLIDVIVTDRDGNPVLGLKPHGFTLTDNGTRQRVSAVEEHRQDSPNSLRPPFAAHPNALTNWVSSPAKGTVNIIVFDTLNTTVLDKARARIQMLKCLRALPPGQQVALFTLGTRLRMIQDFTTSSDVLIAAAEKMAIGPTPLSPSNRSPFSSLDVDDLTTRPETMDVRVAYTLDALRDLARATASLPGRKNVIWLTTGFPIKMNEPEMRLDRSGLIRERDYSDQIRSTAAVLASMQVSVYPIDVKGLVTEAGRAADNLLDQRDTLIALAQETGGRAYYDKNDIDSGIARVLTTDSNYYTLAYSPRDIKWDGSYHKVKVEVERKNLDLTYRRGYHALGDSPLTKQQASRALGEALGLDMMDSRMIVLAAEVTQPGAPGQPIVISCNIDPNTLVLDDAAEGTKTAELAIGATIWDGQKHKVADVAKKAQPSLTPEELEVARTSGIPWKLNVAVHPGAYTLKLAVVDLKSGKTGSLSVPLKIELKPQQTSAPANRGR